MQPPLPKSSNVGLVASALRIEQKVAIAAGDQAIGAAQDGAHLVAKMMIAPVARQDGFVGQECFRDLAVGCRGTPAVIGAQVENMSQLRLLRQGAIASAGRSAVQRPPETARRGEPRLKILVQRQDESVDAARAVGFAGDELMCLVHRLPNAMDLIDFGPCASGIEIGKLDGRLRNFSRSRQLCRAKNQRRSLFGPDDVPR